MALKYIFLFIKFTIRRGVEEINVEEHMIAIG